MRFRPESGLWTRILGSMRRSPVVLLVATLLGTATLAQTPGAPVPASSVSIAGTYRLGPRDLIRVKVFEVPELNVESRVAERGTVNLPLIGDVPAQGLTPEEFGARLEELLEERYVNRASVAIEVLEFRSRPIVVMGAVKSPGNLAFPGRWTLLEALAAAGGLAEGHGDYINVLRRANNGLTDQIAIRVDDLLVRGEARANIPIFANDLINVPVPSEVTIFCLGEVVSPGAQKFRSTERVTVLSAIARAGGLSARASKKISIKRRKGESLQQEIEIDYRKILSGKEPDMTLRDGDVLVIKESLF